MQSHAVDVLANVKKKGSGSQYCSKESNQNSLDGFPVDIHYIDSWHPESSSKQLVLYENDNNATVLEAEPAIDTTLYGTSSFPIFSAPDYSTRVLPSVGTFTVQCARCLKWRLVPSKEKYEEIRENFLEEPFYCEKALEWNSDVTCADPPDILPDDSKLWAIDKPNIAQPPPGWERILRIRGEGSTKFADVYYAAPSGKKLRSMVEIQKYLFEHPEYTSLGVNMSQFSFQIPRPLQENYVRKRSVGIVGANSCGVMGIPRPKEPTEVNLLAWIRPGLDPNLEIEEPGITTLSNKTLPVSPSISGSALKTEKKKSATLPGQEHHGSAYNAPVIINIDDSPSSTNTSLTKKVKKPTKRPVEQGYGSMHDPPTLKVEYSPSVLLPVKKKKKKKKAVMASLKQIYRRSIYDAASAIQVEGFPQSSDG